MRFWVQAMYLQCSSKKGISSDQLHRTLGVTLKTAWFMSHRIREAMRVVGVGPMGGAGEVVEADETFIGRLEGQPKRAKGWGHKNVVLTLVQRGGALAASMWIAPPLRRLLLSSAQISRKETALMTDEARQYLEVGTRVCKP